MPEATYLEQIAAFLDAVRTRARDGITVSDLTQSTVDAMRLTINLLETVNGMTGDQKKAEVMKLVAYVFDTFSDACVPVLAKPVWWIVKPAVRLLVMQVASGMVESLLPMVRGVAC